MLHHRRLESILATLFVTVLVIGTIVLLVTGRSIVLLFGFVGATGVAIVWSVWFTIVTITGYFHAKRYSEVATTTALHGGIVILLVYFFWFFLSEFLQIHIFGLAPPLKSSKLAITGALMVGISTLAIFVVAFLTRHKKSTRRRGD